MLFPLPGVLEMNLTDGSSWPPQGPLSSNRPPQVPRGSVHPPPRSTFTSWYLGLWPLQSIMPVGPGATLVLALAAAVRAEDALAARPLQVAVPMMMINDPASAHSRAHRLPIVVLPGGSPEHTTDMRTPARSPGEWPPRNRPKLHPRALQTSYCGLGFLSTFIQLNPGFAGNYWVFRPGLMGAHTGAAGPATAR